MFSPFRLVQKKKSFRNFKQKLRICKNETFIFSVCTQKYLSTLRSPKLPNLNSNMFTLIFCNHRLKFKIKFRNTCTVVTEKNTTRDNSLAYEEVFAGACDGAAHGGPNGDHM